MPPKKWGNRIGWVSYPSLATCCVHGETSDGLVVRLTLAARPGSAARFICYFIPVSQEVHDVVFF